MTFKKKIFALQGIKYVVLVGRFIPALCKGIINYILIHNLYFNAKLVNNKRLFLTQLWGNILMSPANVMQDKSFYFCQVSIYKYDLDFKNRGWSV